MEIYKKSEKRHRSRKNASFKKRERENYFLAFIFKSFRKRILCPSVSWSVVISNSAESKTPMLNSEHLFFFMMHVYAYYLGFVKLNKCIYVYVREKVMQNI